ncbi:MAG TPA: HAMP domain-containing protein, partial [Thermoanaerobaculia bacterium]|nr:HAMP domain-containing protein [Thermoanaerobaculia bacterium]
GVWRELTENVNSMANNLTLQVRNIAEVSTAIAAGDLSRKITVEVKGEILELKETINTMVDQLSSFADEVTRVSREVGTEGMLGGQAQVRGVSGVWRELTENVNSMANNLTLQVRNITEVATAIAEGDLSRKITVDAKGEILALKNTINTSIDKLSNFAAEVTRVARLVGTEGMLGVQAEVKNVSGTWKELTENVNSMANNLTGQVRDIAQVTTAVANGDLSQKITVEVRGEVSDLKNTLNAMVDQLNAFAAEVTRVAREVGTEGKLGGQASVEGVRGTWKELTDNVNSMASNLTNQVRNISDVAGAVASGDLSRKITVPARGEMSDLKNTLNAMVDQLNAFGAEVTRVAREVGTEGKLGGQASVEGVRGTWKELTDNVNLMANNLTGQVRDIAEVTTAVARGDLTRKIVVDARGEILELKNTVNTMVDQLSSFADEVTRLATEVGVQGTLGGQADVRGVSGTWRDLTDAVNSMASNLTDQVRSISQVATAIAAGDLRKKIVVDARGEILELKSTINTMVDQLGSFAEQVTRVAREVGTEGKLGGQASVEGVRGTWKELTDSVNLMASNLTDQVRDISQVSTAIAQGNLGRKITVEVRGELLALKNTINTMVDQLSSFADEVTRVARDVGVEGKLGGQAQVRGVSGIWKELTDNVNLMASNLTNQVRDIADVTTAVAKGDLSRKIAVEVRGELLALKNTINTMVDQLSSFADEVTRVAREVGTEGILGGQAEVKGVSGTWQELTNNVNVMARNLTEQVRGIARVVTAVANGNLKEKLRLDARGEIATLVTTIDNMIDTLSTFADQVSGVARDVGVEGRLGGQAGVPGAAGIWRDLTNNVNELAGNLTRQVRAIGDVAASVTKGDLTQSIDVEARGEVALLKDSINQMIRTLRETTRTNEEQDWLKTNLARFTRMLQGQRDLLTVADQVLSELAAVVGAQHGAFYMARQEASATVLQLFASYAYRKRKNLANRFELGEGLVGQGALEKKPIVITMAPTDYVVIGSALGEATPRNIVVVPILFEGEVKGVIELASVHEFTAIQLAFIDQLLEGLGIVVATIEATMRTDELLRQSQSMAVALQEQQEELQQSNEELESRALQLTEQRDEVERKNREVELAKQELEEKAEQIALTSKYKSQFLANMSHELRTPLNALLILSRQLADNNDRNLTERQVEFAQTIHQGGTDLLALINEVLDLAKIESGTIGINPEDVSFELIEDYVERSFRHQAEEKGLELKVEVSPDLPASIWTDDMRLRQILRNLLSNALKFTDEGSVALRVAPVAGAADGREAEAWVSFEVVDTGLGIPADRQKTVFEAFQQIDGGTDRRHGGTGLGLAISREITTLLAGHLSVESEPGMGSTFTLELPLDARAELESRAEREPVAPTSPQAILGAVGGPRHASALTGSTVADDRNSIQDGDRVLLLVEDDPAFSTTLVEVARERGYRAVATSTGREALDLARDLGPDLILLDLKLPDMNGWVLLDRLKHMSETRHVPVQIVSAYAEQRRGRLQGAIGVLEKPVNRGALLSMLDTLQQLLERRAKRVMVVAADEEARQGLVDLVGGADGSDVETLAVDSSDAALRALEGDRFDCLVLSHRLPEASTVELLQRLELDPSLDGLPVVVFAEQELEPEAQHEVSRPREHIVVKSVRTPEVLVDAAARFLHRAESELPETQREMLRALAQSAPELQGHKVLVVDDDVRNVFAITALLEQHGMGVVFAENGHEALAKIAEHDDIEAVLMDIMMPEMDGYEAMRRIRLDQRWSELPVIALTAKAMRGDREKCLEAGASDYVMKPIDPDQLVSLLRVWLEPSSPSRRRGA